MHLLVSGAGGGIGRALVSHARAQGWHVSALTHGTEPVADSDACLTHCSDASYSRQLSEFIHSQPYKPGLVIHCGGMLHRDEQQPEKRLADVTPEFLWANMERNCLHGLQLAQALAPLYNRKEPLTLALLSAKVGSISDNHLGGWYSYRMSKAALNMLVRTLAIEWQRSHPLACVAAVHPGTTDTALSQPFQRNISPEKLFTPKQTAARLLNVTSNLTPAGTGRFYHWDGSELPW